MTIRGRIIALAAGLSFAALAPDAHAAFMLTFTQSGGDVIAVGVGSLDTEDLTFSTTGPGGAGFNATAGSLGVGPVGTDDVYLGVSGWQSFGVGTHLASATSGDIVDIAPRKGQLGVPHGYVSGAALSDNETFTGATFASLGLIQGTYVATWGIGSDADTFTVQIGIVPEPMTLAVLGLPAVLLGLLRARRSVLPPARSSER